MKKFKLWLRRILVLICLVVFCYSAIQLGISFWASYQQSKIKEEVTVAVNLPEKIEEEKEFKVDFAKLKEINPDIVGYIIIPKTNISYPILYKKNDTNYYLRRDLYGNYSPPGSIFLDGDAAPDFSDRHTFIYGHNQRDRTMFGDLREFIKKDFFDDIAIGYIFTPTKNYKMEIIAFETSPVNGEAYETIGLDTDTEMAHYLKNIRKNAKYYRDVNVTSSDTLVALSTCGYFDIYNTRDIIHAKISEWK